MTRFVGFVAALCVLGAACESESSAPGEEMGVWCRTVDNPTAGEPAFKILVLDGHSRYWVFSGTTAAAFDERYEMVTEDGLLYWHTWIGEQEYANRVEELSAGDNLVLAEGGGDTLTYHYYRDYTGSFADSAGFLTAYGITDDLTCD